jgi:S-adenosyl methyltransferase
VLDKDKWLNTASSRPVRADHIDPSTPSMARVWNYIVGGRDNFEADRVAVKRLLVAAPVLRTMRDAGRAFYRRAVTYLAAEAKVRQFIDISLGMPTSGVTHEAAQAVAPDSRIVYVASDPLALTHARALLRSSPDGAVSPVNADARDVGAILAGASQTLDLAEPVAVLMIDVLNFVEDASALLSQLVTALPPGSYVAVMQVVADERLASAAKRWSRIVPSRVFLRDHAQVAHWLRDLELVEPGIVEVPQWRPAPGDPEFPGHVPLLGAVARKSRPAAPAALAD